MKQPAKSRHLRGSSIAVVSVVVVAVLLPPLLWAQDPVRYRVAGALLTLTIWATSVWWAWPAAIVLALTALLTPFAHQRLPRLAHRVAVAFGVGAGVITLARLAILDQDALSLGIAAIAVLGLLTVLVLVIPPLFAPRLPLRHLRRLGNPRERLEAVEARVKLQNDVRTTLLQVFAGLTVLATAVVGFQQLNEDRRQAFATLELTRQGQISERFREANEQLSSTNMNTRPVGLYVLGELAGPETHPPRQRRLTIIEIVAAYIRQHAKPVPCSSTASRPAPSPPQDVFAALTILSRRTVLPSDPH